MHKVDGGWSARAQRNIIGVIALPPPTRKGNGSSLWRPAGQNGQTEQHRTALALSTRSDVRLTS